MDVRMDGRVAVITGGSTGLGLAMAKEFGAEVTINAKTNNDVVGAIRELTHGEGAHKTLDTSGAAEARAAAVRATRTWGTVCYVGEHGQVQDRLDLRPVNAHHIAGSVSLALFGLGELLNGIDGVGPGDRGKLSFPALC